MRHFNSKHLCGLLLFPGLAVSLQLLHGDIEQLRREYMVLFTRGVSITKKLGFSDIIMPGEMRNDLYMTLEKGEFEKGGKSVARNVEITVYVLDIEGQVMKSYVAAGSGEPGGDEYHSFVLYHNNSPRWAEQIKLPIPVDMFRGAHVRFEFRHCSSKTLLQHYSGIMYCVWGGKRAVCVCVCAFVCFVVCASACVSVRVSACVRVCVWTPIYTTDIGNVVRGDSYLSKGTFNLGSTASVIMIVVCLLLTRCSFSPL
ncbi:unnamed protein product [Oncorhynchus mykiss]|uniref:C2 DOCK-type domain-containing protein n=1 Tax=Oncorhynchus mykiss TaxID=8022 RepID=A0A060YCD7_ONCMY|nr:unnamed protein product [Oncorhynchus mykiss]